MNSVRKLQLLAFQGSLRTCSKYRLESLSWSCGCSETFLGRTGIDCLEPTHEGENVQNQGLAVHEGQRLRCVGASWIYRARLLKNPGLKSPSQEAVSTALNTPSGDNHFRVMSQYPMSKGIASTYQVSSTLLLSLRLAVTSPSVTHRIFVLYLLLLDSHFYVFNMKDFTLQSEDVPQNTSSSNAVEAQEFYPLDLPLELRLKDSEEQLEYLLLASLILLYRSSSGSEETTFTWGYYEDSTPVTQVFSKLIDVISDADVAVSEVLASVRNLRQTNNVERSNISWEARHLFFAAIHPTGRAAPFVSIVLELSISILISHSRTC